MVSIGCTSWMKAFGMMKHDILLNIQMSTLRIEYTFLLLKFSKDLKFSYEIVITYSQDSTKLT